MKIYTRERQPCIQTEPCLIWLQRFLTAEEHYCYFKQAVSSALGLAVAKPELLLSTSRSLGYTFPPPLEKPYIILKNTAVPNPVFAGSLKSRYP